MIPSRFPIEPIKPDYVHVGDGPMEYVRTEFNDGNPAWLMAEAELASKKVIKRWGIKFRSIVSRIASFLP